MTIEYELIDSRDAQTTVEFCDSVGDPPAVTIAVADGVAADLDVIAGTITSAIR